LTVIFGEDFFLENGTFGQTLRSSKLLPKRHMIFELFPSVLEWCDKHRAYNIWFKRRWKGMKENLAQQKVWPKLQNRI